ncbi:UDP-N-acetylhexosamine pyrophosphorylase [Anabrus simplex]|uniref:UDP-N-acetylhexosamine pyrophosphorylase n=1 Tax=Anabrus simplex TaxID=316456 RepID=UPI0035A2883A
MSELESIKKTLVQYDQEHILQFWDIISSDERDQLLQDIREIDVAEVASFFKTAVASLNEDGAKLDDRLKPIPPESYGSVKRSSESELQCYEEEGLRQISEGRVGVLLMAGGQGTRLGVTHPKGMFDVGLPSRKTLYQIQAERIIKLENLAYEFTGKRNNITWYIMTSEATMQPTEEFFAKHHYFGLKEENVVIYEQGLLPCFTFDGKIIMDQKYKVARAPDGNGGIYRALRDKGILDDMERRGVKYLHAHSVDNILVKVADPVFIGYCVLRGADCGAKVVEKENPTEAVGVVCQVDERFKVVEYSEITQKTAERVDNDGRLTFRAGNICNHFFTTEFLRKIGNDFEDKLILHVAKKKIPFVDTDGQRYKPEKPNGIKMEKFVFDVFPFADNFLTWEVNRNEEFSALKNSDEVADKDNPTTARNDLYALHCRYIIDAGGKICCSKGSVPVCEISPLVSYAGEGLECLVANKTLKAPVLLRHPTEEKNVAITNGTNGCSKDDH